MNGAPESPGQDGWYRDPPRRPRAGWVVLALVAVAVVFAVGAFAVTGWPHAPVSTASTSAANTQRTQDAGAARTQASQSAVPGPSNTAGFRPAGTTPSQDAELTAAAFLQAWSGGATARAASLTDNPAAAQAALTAYAQDLFLRKLAGTVAGSTPATGPAPAGAQTATTLETVTVSLSAVVAASAAPGAQSGTWSYHSTLTAYQVPNGTGWLIEWNSDVLAPNVADGEHLAPVLVPARGSAVTDTAGNPLTSYGDNGLNTVAGLLAQHTPTAPGKPGLSVQIEDAAGQAVSGSQAAVTQPAASRVATTITQPAEQAARTAVAGATGSALVALRMSTGSVLAIANNAQFNDFALTAGVAPGSTMKIITATAMINSGLVTENSPVGCPQTYTVQGQTFRNNEDESEPASTPFSEDFALSCNNAFSEWWGQLSGRLASTAATYYGLDQQWDIGIPGKAASYFTAPAGVTGSELAEEAFGGGELSASPLAMASVAATVGSGQFHQPVLVPGAATVSASPLPASTDQQLKDMMRDVVTEGTAASLGLGPDVYAKTGTADVQGQDQPNSWMVAFDPGQDVAVAALVLQAGYGAQAAGSEVKTFLGGY